MAKKKGAAPPPKKSYPAPDWSGIMMPPKLKGHKPDGEPIYEHFRIVVKNRPDIRHLWNYMPNPPGPIWLYADQKRLLYDQTTRTSKERAATKEVWFDSITVMANDPRTPIIEDLLQSSSNTPTLPKFLALM